MSKWFPKRREQQEDWLGPVIRDAAGKTSRGQPILTKNGLATLLAIALLIWLGVTLKGYLERQYDRLTGYTPPERCEVKVYDVEGSLIDCRPKSEKPTQIIKIDKDGNIIR